MKHTNYISLLCLFSVVLPIQGQNRLEGTQLNEPEALKLVREGDLDTKGETPDLAESDTGAQRPVFLKKNGFLSLTRRAMYVIIYV